jgi:tetratricopeptide (TPR) repeat protein
VSARGGAWRPALALALVLALALAGVAGCARRPRPVEGTAVPEPVAPPLPGADKTVISHTVKTGETLARIADNYYGEPGRAAAIGRRNGLAEGRDPVPGSVLSLEFAPSEWADAQRRAAALEPYNRGVQALAQDRLGEAERLFRLALETAPELPDARYNLALVLLRRGQAEEAVSILTALAGERPGDAEYRCALGNALFQSARFAEATGQFARVLADHPDHRRAAFGRARALQEDGRVDEAATAWRRYLELDPDSSWADVARENLRKLTDGR